MPAAATALLEDACVSGISCLSYRDLLVVIAQAMSDGATAEELLAAACTSKISCLSEHDLFVVIAQGINEGL